MSPNRASKAWIRHFEPHFFGKTTVSHLHILYILYIFPILIPALGLRSLSIFEYPEMEESLTAWTTFLAEDVSNYAKGGRWG